MNTLPCYIIILSIFISPLAGAQDANAIAHLQSEWARIKYQLADKKAQIKEMNALEEEAALLVDTFPNKAEPKIWQGIIGSTAAGMDRGIASLGTLKRAKNLFLAAIKINPDALMGSAYTSLASLYYQLPGWPISFGSNKKAREYFSKALKVNPLGIDSNYFYAQFLTDQNDYRGAKEHYKTALNAPSRYGRELADEGRKQEIRAALTQLSDKIKSLNVDNTEY